MMYINYDMENIQKFYKLKLSYSLLNYARNYIQNPFNRTNNVDYKVREAVLVDVINYISEENMVSMGIVASDLYDENQFNKNNIDIHALNGVANKMGDYLFQNGVVESVLDNQDKHDCCEKFDANEGALVIIDYLNYMAKEIGYDTTFTVKELYNRYKVNQYNKDMIKLKKFLEKTSEYTRLLERSSIESIFNDMAEMHHFKYSLKDGDYQYTDDLANKYCRKKMYPHDIIKIEDEIYAMAYAYTKYLYKDRTGNPYIDNKLLEMKRK